MADIFKHSDRDQDVDLHLPQTHSDEGQCWDQQHVNVVKRD